MIKSNPRFSLILLALFIFPWVGHAQSNPFDWEAYMKTSTRIGNLQFSPDGDQLLFSTRNADFENNQWKNEWHIFEIESRKDSILKFDQDGVSSIKWSPSGKKMSFLARNEEKRQLFMLDYPNGKAEQVSEHATGIRSYSWSPDETKIAFTAADPKPEKTEADKYITAFEAGPQGYLDDQPFLPAHLFILNLEDGTFKRMTEGPWTINSGVSWSPDGQRIICTKKSNAYVSGWNESSIITLDVSSGEISPLSDQSGFEYSPSYPAKENFLLYGKKTDRNPAGITDLILRFEDGIQVNLTSAIDRNTKRSIWVEGQNKFLLIAKDGTRDGVWWVDLKGKAKKSPISNQFSISNAAVNIKKAIAIVASTGENPSEIYLIIDEKKDPIKLTAFHDIFRSMDLGKIESMEWDTDNGMKADGVITYPPDFDSNQKYPLVLFIHGGPTSSSMESFNPVAQYMATKGWIIFQPNYRGSDNKGDAFQEAIMNDGGEGPGKDVMAGIEVLKQKGFVDESRIGVSGWSYGGFMTSWLIGCYPDVWKAAVAGASPIDFTDMTSLSRMNLTLRHAITNSPWVGDNYQQHFEMSPLKNLSKIKVPTLVMSKVEDQVVTVTGSYKLYHALLANDIPTKFIAYPGGGHFPGDPVNQKDVYDRWVGWLEKYLD